MSPAKWIEWATLTDDLYRTKTCIRRHISTLSLWIQLPVAAKELCAFLPWIPNEIICICAHPWALARTTLHKVGKLHLGKAHCVPHPVLNILCSHCRHHLAHQRHSASARRGEKSDRKNSAQSYSTHQAWEHLELWGFVDSPPWTRRTLFINGEVKQWRAGCWWPVISASLWPFTCYAKEVPRTPKILWITYKVITRKESMWRK